MCSSDLFSVDLACAPDVIPSILFAFAACMLCCTTILIIESSLNSNFVGYYVFSSGNPFPKVFLLRHFAVTRHKHLLMLCDLVSNKRSVPGVPHLLPEFKTDQELNLSFKLSASFFASAFIRSFHRILLISCCASLEMPGSA